MSLDCFRYAFGLSASEHWPALEKRQEIPAAAKSKHNTRTGRLGLGFVEAISFLLTDQVALFRGGAGSAFGVEYLSNSSGEKRVADARAQSNSAPGLPPRTWRGADSMKGPPLLALLEATLLPATTSGGDPELVETRERWEALLEELELELMEPAPYTKPQLLAASASELCQEAVMGLSDALYFALKRLDESGARGFATGSGRLVDLEPLGEADVDRLFGRPVSSGAGPGAALPGGYLERTLTGLIQTGGTALLVGPTGTFKTTTAKRAAGGADLALQVVKGRPGIEDRDFFGGVVPTEEGPAWRDGPVTKSFRTGRTEPVMLLMDELMRFEPLFRGALVGLLDPATPAELEARGAAPAGGFETEAHYVAELPTGEQVACPTSQITLVATTNMGTDYVQAVGGGGRGLDPALMGRFELCVEVETPDPDVKRHLYEEATGSPRGADFLEAVEEAVSGGHIDTGGLYVRRAHPRLMLNMARQMDRLEQQPPSDAAAGDGAEGSPAARAKQAARVTVVPSCVERGASGLLDPAGRDALLEDVADCAREILE